MNWWDAPDLGNDKYPKTDFAGQEDQSFGFNPAYKLQTGVMRGQQQIGTEQIKIDSANRRFFVRDNDTGQEAVLGRLPDGVIALVITKPGVTVEDAIT